MKEWRRIVNITDATSICMYTQPILHYILELVIEQKTIRNIPFYP